MALATNQDFAVKARIDPQRITSILLWLTVFSGSFVLFEPAPYEAAFALLAYAALISGTRVPPLLAIPVILLTVWTVGGLSAVAVNDGGTRGLTYVLISFFLAFTTIVTAALMAHDPQRNLRIITSAYIATAVIASLCGIAGHFSLGPGADMFHMYGRAKGMFKDPNVFSPFLILPALLLFQQILYSSRLKLAMACGLFVILLAAILLSFSRASWAHLIFSGLVMAGLMLITSHSNRLRVRIIAIGLLSIFIGAAAITALLSIPEVSEIFAMRFSLTQDYDSGETGRFGNQLRSLADLIQSPFGFGPYQFATRFHQDPHNVYLNGFFSYGWLGGFAYIAFVIATWVAGARYLFVSTPWQHFQIAAFATFLGLSLEGFVIDTDHWRHFFLLAGLVWGLSAATIGYGHHGRAWLPRR